MTRHTHGLRAWLLQRVSAVYLAGFLVYLLVHFMFRQEHGYEQWRDWVAHPLVSIAAAGFILAVLIHGWVGMRDIILDYVQLLGLRLLLLSLIALVLAGSGFWALRVLVLVGS